MVWGGRALGRGSWGRDFGPAAVPPGSRIVTRFCSRRAAQAQRRRSHREGRAPGRARRELGRDGTSSSSPSPTPCAHPLMATSAPRGAAPSPPSPPPAAARAAPCCGLTSTMLSTAPACLPGPRDGRRRPMSSRGGGRGEPPRARARRRRSGVRGRGESPGRPVEGRWAGRRSPGGEVQPGEGGAARALLRGRRAGRSAAPRLAPSKSRPPAPARDGLPPP